MLNNPSIGVRNLPSSYNKRLYTQQPTLVGLTPLARQKVTSVETFVTPDLSHLHVINNAGRSINLYAYTADGRLVLHRILPEGQHVLNLKQGWHPLKIWYF
ncbi:MAG: hypothetical protein BWY72_02100 [Bacteroidetes bacterium ADurb.Bin416]|nr:MAG: hypothetical protein BWY72_02100 [Bacteroidetes bacterium ADurb.Bin416]